MDDTGYTLDELAEASGLNPRTIRYYIHRGLLPSPVAAGPATRYTRGHLDRLRAIRFFQSRQLPLVSIEERLARMSDDEIASIPAPEEPTAAPPARREGGVPGQGLAWSGPPMPPATSRGPGTDALRYVSMVRDQLGRPPLEPREASDEPGRSSWERIELHPDVEVHVRRPLDRDMRRRVERLIELARNVLST